MKTMIDFEYRNKPRTNGNDWNNIELVSVAIMETGEQQPRFFKLDTLENIEIFKNEWLSKPRHIVCFNAVAEICGLLKAGLSKDQIGDVTDFWVECKMLLLTIDVANPRVANNIRLSKEAGFSLASVMKVIASCNKREQDYILSFTKKDVRDLILSKTDYNRSEWDLIEEYNKSDVLALKIIFNKFLKRFWSDNKITWAHSTDRGKYVRALAFSMFFGRGIPINESFLELMYEKKQSILQWHRDKVNEFCEDGYFIYETIEGRWTRGNKRYESRYIDEKVTQKKNNFEKVLKERGLLSSWKRTKKGAISRDKSTLEEFIRENEHEPFIDALYYARNIENQYKSKKETNQRNPRDYRDLVSEAGYVIPLTFPFHQVTSRSSPKPKAGFAFNLTPWQKRMVQPKPGMCLIHADWNKQELAIAAYLSKDKQFQEDLEKDIYTANAKMCGLITDDMDPAEAKQIRQHFKSIVLGMGYGKQEHTVCHDLQRIYGLSAKEAEEKASSLFRNRRKRYPKYTQWIDDFIIKARANGKYVSLDNWIYFVSCYTKDTQLFNLPMQSNGAAIMRKGFIRAVEQDLDVVCSLHDALYVNCKVEDLEQTKIKLEKAMQLGVKDILGQQANIAVEMKTYHQGESYKDDQQRDLRTLKSLAKLEPEFEQFLTKKEKEK